MISNYTSNHRVKGRSDYELRRVGCYDLSCVWADIPIDIIVLLYYKKTYHYAYHFHKDCWASIKLKTAWEEALSTDAWIIFELEQ